MRIEKVEERREGIEDITACGEAVSRFHTLCILREDLNRHNIVVVDGGRVHVVDFKNAMDDEDVKAEIAS